MKKKKISKYFKDEKLSLFEKDKTWLLINNTKEIIWIIGKRLDDRFKVNEKTKNILNIILNKKKIKNFYIKNEK
ncbi:tRNA lysidine(34) synthetase TilS C-terminal domain-containing protein [Candidatus Shikimatogenerans silvanidophilus]|uniref:tRNA lysidine(34) synthetase TilS C-terminal domain-containing protein n=1 Tax=Candidatus Shikimatogenerans silvanidophilus TaxID=2782547 RepID=UPI001BA7AC4A|nr:tRNA lysidine(34) synthetase TilS C-terminal domain-containing protein [Candidatus Shikimatogenerans silvanidophilus]